MALNRIFDLPLVGRRRRKEDTITLADRARDAHQWELAAELYKEALDQNPRNSPIWVQYGHALKEWGELRDPDKLIQAETAYRRALSLDSGVADTYLQLGHLLKLQGRSEEAKACYLRASALEPSLPHPFQELQGLGWSEVQVAELRSMVKAPLAMPIPPEATVERNPEKKKTEANASRDLVKAGAITSARPNRRVQVYRHSSLGDVLLITPLLKELRKKYEFDEIVVVTALPDILHGNPYIDQIVKSQDPLPGFDQTLVLEYETRPEEHIVDAYSRIAQVSVVDRTPEIYLTQDERLSANDLLIRAGISIDKQFCAMQVTSQWLVRNWPMARFHAVAEALEREGIPVVILGHERHPPISFGVDLREQTTIRIAAAIIEKCALLVTVDSGLMHIGYAFHRPVVALFGCTDPEKRVPDWGLSSTLYSDIVCRGCHHRQRPVPVRTPPQCPWETVRCMERLSSVMVIAKVQLELERNRSPFVSIVIPHYFRSEMLNACLSSIFRYGAGCSFEVVVVANGSPDESMRQLQGWLPNVRIVTLQPNQGFAKACNSGAEAARGEYLLFLNDDTTVTAGWLDEMVNLIKANPEIGIVGPKLLYPENDRIQHCGTVINERGMGEHIWGNLPSAFARANRPRYYRALTGACLLIERDFFLSLGEFETSYHGTGGCEDTDLCFKVLKRNKMVAYCPSSVVYHHEGVTRGRRAEEHPEEMNNRSLLRQRWEDYLIPDIADYYLLGEIEAGEGRSWLWLRDVPQEVISRYASPRLRSVGPHRIQVGSGVRSKLGYLHLDSSPNAPRVDLVHTLSEPLPFLEESISEILADHMFERVSWRALPGIIQEFHRVLIPGGRLVIKSTDLHHVAESYLKRANGVGRAADEIDDAPFPPGITPVMQANASLFGSQGDSMDFYTACLDSRGLHALCLSAGFTEVRLEEPARSDSAEIELVAVR
jgi:GT2 family glycosyltransferase/ADP-heptose:LPS heptosyltransferase/Tfp pilus assembly protein PilF